MERIVWQYWETPSGKCKPPHIELCQDILRQQLAGCRLEVVNSDTLYDLLPDIHSNIEKITCSDQDDAPSLAIKAGIIRVLLLEKYGGLWVDSDAIVLKPLAFVFDLIQRYEFVGMRRTSSKRQHVVNNFFGSMPKATIISEYAKEIAGLLSQRTSFFWNEVGSVSLTPIVDRQPNLAYLFPERLIHPLLPKDQPKLLSKELSPSEVIPEDAITLMLFHRIFEGKHPKAGRGFRDFSRKDIIESDTLLGKCVREIGID